MSVNTDQIRSHIHHLALDIGSCETVRYFCHMLTKDTSFNCSDDVDSRLRAFGMSIRSMSGLGPIGHVIQQPVEEFVQSEFRLVPDEFKEDLRHLEPPKQPVKMSVVTTKTVAKHATVLVEEFNNIVPELPDRVREAVESILQNAAIGKTERVLMLDPRQSTKTAKALEKLGFKTETVKCKNGKHKVTVTYG